MGGLAVLKYYDLLCELALQLTARLIKVGGGGGEERGGVVVSVTHSLFLPKNTVLT